MKVIGLFQNQRNTLPECHANFEITHGKHFFMNIRKMKFVSRVKVLGQKLNFFFKVKDDVS